MRTLRTTVISALVFLASCANSQQFMLKSERVLDAGSDAWNAHTAQVIQDCKDKDLATDKLREECVEPEYTINKKIVEPSVITAVAAMRAYWLGVSIGKDPKDLAKHVSDFISATSDLPLSHFGGLRKLKP